MKVTCGADIIEINRIKEDIETFGNIFLNKIYTNKEIEYCERKNVQKYQHYSARFAAKEAVFKAISNILENKYTLSWKDIEILNNAQGKPIVNLKGQAYKEIENIDISLSHCQSYATANVVVLWR